MSDTEDRSSKFSGFRNYSTFKHKGFNDRNISDIERILIKLRQDAKFMELSAFDDVLFHHILDRHAHNLGIDDLCDSLITQLYHSYRDLGYKGTRDDMIKATVKDVDIGSIPECRVGINEKKAVSVPGWLEMFDNHDTDPQSHESFFESLTPNDAFNTEADFHLDTLIGDQKFLIESGLYAVEWSSPDSTLYLSISYNFKDYVSDTEPTITLCEFYSYSRHYKIVVVGNVIGTIRKPQVLLMERDDAAGTDKFIGMARLSFEQEGYDRILLIQKRDGSVILRTMTDRVFLNKIFTKNTKHLLINCPIKARADTSNRVTIKEISHYPAAASTSQQLYFLN